MRDGDAIRLTIRGPSGEERESRFDQDVIRVGRARDCDLQLESGYISRYHARLERHGEEWSLVDEGSKNGVILNGRRMTGNHALFSGDTIRLGDFTLIFHLADTLDSDRTIIYPFAAAELDAQLLAARAAAAPPPPPRTAEPATAANTAVPAVAARSLPAEPAVDRAAPEFHAEETRPTPADPPPDTLSRRELAAYTQLAARAEAGTAAESLGDAAWWPGAWDSAMLERLVARLDGKLRVHDARGVTLDRAGRYRLLPAGTR